MEIPKSKDGNKLLNFIKAKPLFFTLIIIGTSAVIAAAIVVPIILLNKKDSKDEDTNNKDNNNPGNNENSNNNDGLQTYSNIINIDKVKSVDLSSIDISTQLSNIGSNSDTLDHFCNYLNGINLNDDKAKVKLIYKWVAENIEYDYEKYKANIPVDCEPANVLTNKKTVCSGYARLFTKLLTCLGYPPENPTRKYKKYNWPFKRIRV